MWKQRLEAMSDLKVLHFNVDMAAMAKYMLLVQLAAQHHQNRHVVVCAFDRIR
jgi:hypothetical protein